MAINYKKLLNVTCAECRRICMHIRRDGVLKKHKFSQLRIYDSYFLRDPFHYPNQRQKEHPFNESDLIIAKKLSDLLLLLRGEPEESLIFDSIW